MATALSIMAPNADFAIETYAEVIGDLKPLLAEHWRELALYQDDIPLDPDFSVYEAMDQAGAMTVFTVRIEGALVGYAVYFVRRHPHYQGHVWANADLFWLHPDHRNMGVGNGLFAFIETGLRERGVDVMHTTFKKDHPAAGLLLEHRAHRMVEIGYSKRLR